MNDVLQDDAVVEDASLAAIERSVVAAIMLDEAVLPFALAELVGDDFQDSRLGVIFEGMVTMRAGREPIDVLTVGEHLAGWGVRGIEKVDLHRWVSEVTTAANVGWYAGRVHDQAIRRDVRSTAAGLMQATSSTDPAGEMLARAIERLRALQERRVSKPIRSRKLGQVLDQDTEYDWVMDGLLERGDRLVLTGIEGGGKTTLLRQLAIMGSAGLQPFTGAATRPARVMYIDVENSERQWAREARPMAQWAASQTGSLDPRQVLELHCMPRLELNRDADLGMLHHLCDEHRPDLMVLGPLYRLVRGSVNSDDEAEPLLSALDTFRDRGITLMIEAHAGHQRDRAGDREMRPRGSAALLGWPEFGMGIRASKDTGVDLVSWRGHRDRKRRWPSRLVRGNDSLPWLPGVDR